MRTRGLTTLARRAVAVLALAGRAFAGRAFAVLALAALCAGCGAAGRVTTTAPGPTTSSSSTTTTTTAKPAYQVHPQAVEPAAGATAKVTAPPASVTAGVSVSGAGQDVSLAKPLSNAAIRAQLAASGMTADPNQATLTSDGLAIAPVGAPAAVQAIINAGNEIARLPYRYAGGHETYQDTAYDCSGSISYVLAAAHLLGETVDSTELETFGDAGPGKWITIFANDGHTFMYVAGLRFDTVALAETGSRWSDRPADEPDIATFVRRHPAGL